MNKYGFTLLEVLVAIAVAAIFLPAVGKLLSFGLLTSAQGQKYTQAHVLSQQAMEAIFYLKANDIDQWDWTSKPVNTSSEQYYQPAKNSGKWQLGTLTTSPVPDGAQFTTTVQIFPVRRCGLEICTSESAPIDPTSRKIEVKVLFLDNGEQNQVIQKAYVTKH